MLGRGQLRCIGATTINEFRKYIEKDPALERRFQQVRGICWVRSLASIPCPCSSLELDQPPVDAQGERRSRHVRVA